VKLDIVYLKLHNGDDIIGHNVSSDDESYCIENPLQVRVHPIHGMFAKSWLLLSVETIVILSKKDILFFGEANEKAKLYYSTFLDRLDQASSDEEPSEDERRDEIESRLLAMIEADTSTKH
jgi:hypothetical protein